MLDEKKTERTNFILSLLIIIMFVIAVLCPLANIDGENVYMIPMSSTSTILWDWTNISAFAITFLILLLVNLYFLFQNKFRYCAVLSILKIIISFPILIVVWILSLDAMDNNISFSYGSSWIFIFLALIISLFLLYKNRRKSSITSV
ncbi:MAG: hypothetical protein KKG93_00760 [Bacteroidetes bacterium]|nr:hypothetical protein [Bacteroidota bacterium]